MSTDLLLVLALLLGCVGLFIWGRPRMDVVALLVIAALPLTGVLNMQEALAGFSDPNVILIAALFVVGEGLVRTGVSYRLGDWLLKRAGNSETRLLVLLMLSVAALGSVMSSTGVVAIFIPVVLGISVRLGVQPGRLMMPLAFAGLISGMLTLVATPPNLLVDSALRREGHAGLGFFSFTPLGAIILALGIGYMLLARRWLAKTGVKNAARSGPGMGTRRRMRDFVSAYELAGREHRLRLRTDSPLVGVKLRELTLRRDYQANVVAIERRGRFSDEVLPPNAGIELRAGDVLLIDLASEAAGTTGREGRADVLCAEKGLEALPLPEGYFSDQSRAIGMAEVLLPPGSRLVGKSVLGVGFRRKHGLNVIGRRRDREPVVGGSTELLEERLRVGDTLLVIGPWKAIRQLQPQIEDFVVLTLPAEVDEVAPALSREPYALLSLGLMIVLMVTGIVPNVVAALAACFVMGAFRCIDLAAAYRAIHWQSLVLIAGMIPFAMALERTGGVDLAVNGLLGIAGNAAPRVLLGGLFGLTMVTGLFISNTATAVLMAPIAVSLAERMGLSPLPFAMTVALAASTAFITPVSSPVNMLVLGPGQYRFTDFVKTGLPFALLVMLLCVVLIPLLFPL
ncbi:citrate transporter [Cephaloticoccus primus]|uniref:Citrate transporter n=1 Tax=Cephaloticoccus primus TaxID=1548207 RepID=A0A139SNC1_9BACT|nr:citrate transporter [Cephaloticoccus primus]